MSYVETDFFITMAAALNVYCLPEFLSGLQKCLDELKNHCQELQSEVNVRKSKCEISKDTTPKPTHFDSDSGGSDNEDDNAFEEDLYLSPVLRSPASSFCGSKDEFFSEQRVILLSGNAYHIAREILLTERTYVKDLEVLTVSFRSIVSADNMIPEKLLKLLYDNIDPLYDFHCSLLAELEERLSSWETMESNDRVQRIGDIMQRNMRQIKLYTSYIQKHDQILIELENEAKRSKKFEKAYKEFELQKICYLPLNTFLLKPVQRLLYYKSILGRLSKEYHRDHPDLKDVKNAHEEVMTACKQINESTRNLENLHKMVELERDLIGIDDLVHPAREFIREGCLHKVCRKGPQPRMFFLFSDILLYTSQGVVSTNQFRVRSQIPLHTMKIEEGGVELHGLYAFTVHGEGSRSFVVAASSPEEKYKWMEDLQTSIAKAKEKTICRTCHSNKSEFVSQIGQELGIFCSSCRAEIERLGDLREDERKKYLNSQFPVPVNIRKQNQDQDSDDECIGSIERVSSLDRRHAHARTMSTRKVCWHRNTSISMKEYTLSVQNNISGELWRKFKNSSKWQKLWVVFTNFCLFFFKSYEDDAPLASLPLIGYSISKASEVDNIQEDYTFKLQFKTHVYFFRATNDYDFQRWIEVISSATKNASRARIFSRMASNDP